MFLINPAEAASDWEGVNKTIKAILEKADAEIVSMRKWDERKLAYNIKGQSRGTYILCYFKAEGDKIREIERDVQLSERIMRVLILNAEQQTKEDIEKDTPATLAERQGRPPAEGLRLSSVECPGKPAVDLAIPNGSRETTEAEKSEHLKEAAVRTSKESEESGAGERIERDGPPT
jgi:small subunit ribosomal protein S6